MLISSGHSKRCMLQANYNGYFVNADYITPCEKEVRKEEKHVSLRFNLALNPYSYLVKFHNWIHLRFIFSLLEFEPSERDFLPHVRFFLGNLQNVFLQGFYLMKKKKHQLVAHIETIFGSWGT